MLSLLLATSEDRESVLKSSTCCLYCLLQVKTERERSQVFDMLSLLLATSEDRESVLKSSTCCLYCSLQVKTERAFSSLRHVVSTARYK